jgi:hypothetical protein
MRQHAGDAATHSFLGGWYVIILGVLGFGFLALALRRLFGRPRKPAVVTPPAGTWKVAAIVIAALLLIPAVPLGVWWLSYRSSEDVAGRLAENAPFVAKFPQGTVELVALTDHPSVTNQPWWRPDGSISGESFARNPGGRYWVLGKEIREIVFRIRGAISTSSVPTVEFDAASGLSGQGWIVDQETLDPPCIRMIVPFACPPRMKKKKTNIRVHDANDLWKVEFRNVSLELGYKTQVKVVDAAEESGSTSAATSTFGPAITQVLGAVEGNTTHWLDLDTGRHMSLSFPDDEAAKRALFRTNGLDLMGIVTKTEIGVACREMMVRQVDGSRWDRATAQEIVSETASAPVGSGADDVSVITASPRRKVTMFFRTREGGHGILQIIGQSESPLGIKIHYKLLQAPSPTPAGKLQDGPMEKMPPPTVQTPSAGGRGMFAGMSGPGESEFPGGGHSGRDPESLRLNLQQAQTDLLRAKALYDAGTATLSEYKTAQLARDLAAAELSGDTGAILRARLQSAREELLGVESRFKAGRATQTEIEKAKLAKDLAEARLSGDAAAIARMELQSAQQEFLEVEARFNAGVATQAEFEKAKAAHDTAQAELGMAGEPPKLRFLAWQDENPSWRDWRVWRPNGERADTAEEQGLLLHHPPTRIDLSATKEGRGVRVLFVWFSHPQIERRSYAEMTMADSTGCTISPCPDGYGGGIYPAKASEAELGWLVRWFAPALDATLPSTVNLTLRYSLGDWQYPLMVTREMFGGTMDTEWGNIPGAGETLDGRAFISLARDTTKGRDLQVDFAAETIDGRLIEPSGTLESGPPEMRHGRFLFDAPLRQIKEFRLRGIPRRCRCRPFPRPNPPPSAR